MFQSGVCATPVCLSENVKFFKNIKMIAAQSSMIVVTIHTTQVQVTSRSSFKSFQKSNLWPPPPPPKSSEEIRNIGHWAMVLVHRQLHWALTSLQSCIHFWIRKVYVSRNSNNFHNSKFCAMNRTKFWTEKTKKRGITGDIGIERSNTTVAGPGQIKYACLGVCIPCFCE
jgi:hypothetical protein